MESSTALILSAIVGGIAVGFPLGLLTGKRIERRRLRQDPLGYFTKYFFQDFNRWVLDIQRMINNYVAYYTTWMSQLLEKRDGVWQKYDC